MRTLPYMCHLGSPGKSRDDHLRLAVDLYRTRALSEVLVNQDMSMCGRGCHFLIWFRCLNAAAAKHACGTTRTKGSVENDLCTAPAYGAQAALVRWGVVHHRYRRAQAPAQSRAPDMEEPQEEAQATTRYCLAYKLRLPWLWLDFG